MDGMGRLHGTLDERAAPEMVCALILEVVGDRLLPAQRRVLQRAASGRGHGEDDFGRVPAAVHKVRTLMALFDKQLSDEAVLRMATDPWVLLAQLNFLAPFLGWIGGDFTRATPLNRLQRADMGIDMPARRYRHVVRQMRATQVQARRMQEQVLLRQLRLVGYSGMAYSIRVEEMRADPDGAAFAAYWVARNNRLPVFTVEGWNDPFDVVAQTLMNRCLAGAGTDWWMVARACPLPVFLARISDRKRGELMAQWVQFMRLAADRMHTMTRADRWPAGFDDRRMVALQGMDTWTWNTLAACYNAARAGWMSCLAAAGSLRLLNAFCPGKAMLLNNGHRVPPEYREYPVWAALPKPWEALNGMSCTARTVELVCRQHGVDPRVTGWTVAAAGDDMRWAPSRGLVEGIQDGDQRWADVLADAGALQPVAGP